MLVRDVLPLLSEGNIIIVDGLDNEVWHGMRSDVSEESGVLLLSVTLVDYDTLNDEFVIWVKNRDEHFYEIELILSDCLRWADEGRVISYVNIAHAGRRIVHLAEVRLAKIMGRWDA